MSESDYIVEYLFDEKANTRYIFLKIPQTKSDGTKQIPRVYASDGVNRGTKTAQEIASENGFKICINAGLFNPTINTYEPEGMIIENRVVLQNKPAVFYPDSKPLTIDSDGKLGYVDPSYDANELVSDGICCAVCGFMPIVINHEAVSSDKWTKVPHYTSKHQRQIIGQFENGDYAIITGEGRGYADSDGWTIKEVQNICIKHELKFAYNLDGGTSTETVVDGKLLNSLYQRHELRRAPTFIVF